MKNKKKILMPIMALVLSVILFGYQVPNIKAEEPEVIPNVYNPGSIIFEEDENNFVETYTVFNGAISLEDYTFITTNSANYFLNDILIELKDPVYEEESENYSNYRYTLLFMDKEMMVDIDNDSIIEEYMIFIYFPLELDIINVKFQHAVLENPKVTFMNGEVQYLVQEIEKGNTITPPASPTKEGYVFVGWYKDAELLEAFNLSETVTEDMTLYAKFIEDSGGVVIPPEETEENNKTLYLVGAAALLLVLGMAIKINKPTKKKGK